MAKNLKTPQGFTIINAKKITNYGKNLVYIL
jgi:hypothetical protein